MQAFGNGIQIGQSNATAATMPAAGGLSFIEIFFYLQILDFMTTLVGLRLGGTEMTPFVRWMMQGDIVSGLLVAKFIGFILAGICLWLRKERVIHWVNYIFAGVVVWNLYNILRGLNLV